MTAVEVLAFGDAGRWEAWLAEHCATSAEAGRSGPRTRPTSFLQRYSPRRRGSPWSRVNVERAEALIAAGRMRAPGLAEIEAARADGRWEAAYESQRTATVPADLAAALARDEPARAFFESLGRTDRYAVILRLLKARTAASRAAQLRQVVALLRAGRRVS